MVAALCACAGCAQAERVKDIASVSGVRGNQLVGYGLVVGLDGTGDQTSQAPFTIQSIKNMLAKFGVTIPPNANPQLKNVAAVTVTADLPPFSKTGQTIDVTVSSIGNAASLRGGTLLMTPLRGVDGEVYGIAQGSLVVSGFGVKGSDGSKLSINVPSSGRVPNGATVESEVPNNFAGAAFRDAEPAYAGLHHGRASCRRHQPAAGRRHGPGHGCGVGQGGGAAGSESADCLSVDAGSRRDRAGRRAGARDRQLAHRHGGDRLACAGIAGRGGAWLAVGDHHRASGCEPARAALRAARPW